MEHIFNHTHSYNFNWPKSINDYTSQKRNLEWGKTPNPEIITGLMIKQNDHFFNPIIQTYTSKTLERTTKNNEHNALIDTIAKNQDNQLISEQTFNIINLSDRLKGFENDPNYPIAKETNNTCKNHLTNKSNYNIISTLPYKEHHYDKPENRPKSEVPNHKSTITFKTYNKRDYDIISTKYKHFHDEKTAIDKEINKIKTATNFYQRNDYNPIKGKYFDESKEQEYITKLNAKMKNWGVEYKAKLPPCAKGQSEKFNFLNGEAVNKDELQKFDLKEKNKKQRYQLRYKIENFYRNQSMRQLDRKNNACTEKFSYQRFKEVDARQYNIIDLNELPYKKHLHNSKRDNLTEWEKLISKAGDNNTFKTKQIYKDVYDCSECWINYDKFKRVRSEKLLGVPKLFKDDIFGESVMKVNKVNIGVKAEKGEKEENEKINVRERMKEWNKEKFFKGKKNVDYTNKGVNKIITHNVEMNKRSEVAAMVKEKNMTNKYNTSKVKEVEY